MSKLPEIRARIRTLHREDEARVLADLARRHSLDEQARVAASADAAELIRDIRKAADSSLMDVFLAEYGLSTDEGVALMCLAEALLRVPDAQTVDELIEDKIAPSEWGEHLGKSSSSLVNASTWALLLTGKVLKDQDSGGLAQTLHNAVRRLGEPVIRTAVKRVMGEMGHQFVLGQDIAEATRRGAHQQKKGFTYSYDMLGEAAMTARDAQTFFNSYRDAIEHLAKSATHQDTRDNPGLSVKLSALHPRYEVSHRARVMKELVPRAKQLAIIAKDARMGFNIDAEEAERLDLSLDVIEELIRSPEFEGWNGFGVVVQAYGKRAAAVIDWLYELAVELDRQFMVRLVKGAYWDTEIKLAQVNGVSDFPVFTHKSATDVSYICCARKLLDYSDRIYPQFATHNAHSVCAILNMAKDSQAYEFQRLHGMGEVLHKLVMEKHETRCRIYAPVGTHRDLLAYLVRRLLENGANSSFINQVVDEDVPPELIAADPFTILDAKAVTRVSNIKKPTDLYMPHRVNSKGWDLRNYDDLDAFLVARSHFMDHRWTSEPIIADNSDAVNTEESERNHIKTYPTQPDTSRNTLSPVYNPNDSTDLVGHASAATAQQVEMALANATSWASSSAEERQVILTRAAELYEHHAGEIFAALCREAGKTLLDAVAEIREAVDFLRFYALEAVRLAQAPERGIVTCISPWNFPLAIFTGQISAALAAGNGVLAKPAEPTTIVASIAVRLMHEAGVPRAALQLLPGGGTTVGTTITSDPRVNGICFTGSTGVAQLIYRNACSNLEPDSTFIAETGGLNAMIVDSSALPEQAVRDIVDSSFRSCGQRCSALRVLYLQKDIADDFLTMLFGAMDELEIADSKNIFSDVGPVITTIARQQIIDHIDNARSSGRLLKQLNAPEEGLFVGPAVIRVDGIQSLEKEIFGPVLHVTTFDVSEIDRIVDDINASGFGLTFGLHTRIDDRVQRITSKLKVGNIYVNRNQIGAVVESQPFGGEGLSGTGPKAGGPLYVERFKRLPLPANESVTGNEAPISTVQEALNEAVTDTHAAIRSRVMRGPTGESNRWSTFAKGTILCLGPSASDARQQMDMLAKLGCNSVAVAPGVTGPNTISGYLPRQSLTVLDGFAAVVLWAQKDDLISAREALAERQGALIQLIATSDLQALCVQERHICIDTTAAGGNTSLLAAQ